MSAAYTFLAWSSLVGDVQEAGAAPNFDAMAQCLASLGFSSAAALCQSWSLVPPEESLWRTKLKQWDQEITALSARHSPLPQKMTSQKNQSSLMPKPSGQGLNEVQRLLDEGLIAQASNLLVQLAHENGLPPGLCNRVAMLKERLNDFWQAECWYRTSLSAVRTQPLAWFGLASTLMQQWAFDEALEAACAGLELYPLHPWGLKLRQRALTDLGATQTLARLASKGELAFPLDSSNSSVAIEPASLDSLGSLRLKEKFLLSPILSIPQVLIWLVGPNSHKTLLSIAGQGLVGCGARVQPFADPDSFLLSNLMQSDGCVLEPSLPYYWIGHQKQRPALVILSSSIISSCPLVIRQLIDGSELALLAPSHLIFNPLQHEAVDIGHSHLLWMPSANEQQ